MTFHSFSSVLARCLLFLLRLSLPQTKTSNLSFTHAMLPDSLEQKGDLSKNNSRSEMVFLMSKYFPSIKKQTNKQTIEKHRAKLAMARPAWLLRCRGNVVSGQASPPPAPGTQRQQDTPSLDAKKQHIPSVAISRMSSPCACATTPYKRPGPPLLSSSLHPHP